MSAALISQLLPYGPLGLACVLVFFYRVSLEPAVKTAASLAVFFLFLPLLVLVGLRRARLQKILDRILLGLYEPATNSGDANGGINRGTQTGADITRRGMPSPRKPKDGEKTGT